MTIPVQAREAELKQTQQREVSELAVEQTQQGEVSELAVEQTQQGEVLELAMEQVQQGEMSESTEEQGTDSGGITEVSRFTTSEGEIDDKASPREDADTAIRHQKDGESIQIVPGYEEQ